MWSHSVPILCHGFARARCTRCGHAFLMAARGPPTDWGEFVQVHDDRDVFQGRIEDLPAIDIHSL
ncbi:MAG: hypothetical protein EBZ74_05945 [Planctomycetia bacterium]|nr:hypothetical protein [Planctomycetia bacterium]